MLKQNIHKTSNRAILWTMFCFYVLNLFSNWLIFWTFCQFMPWSFWAVWAQAQLIGEFHVYTQTIEIRLWIVYETFEWFCCSKMYSKNYNSLFSALNASNVREWKKNANSTFKWCKICENKVFIKIKNPIPTIHFFGPPFCAIKLSKMKKKKRRNTYNWAHHHRRYHW